MNKISRKTNPQARELECLHVFGRVEGDEKREKETERTRERHKYILSQSYDFYMLRFSVLELYFCYRVLLFSVFSFY